MQRWSGGMQCKVAVMVVCVKCGYEGGGALGCVSRCMGVGVYVAGEWV